MSSGEGIFRRMRNWLFGSPPPEAPPEALPQTRLGSLTPPPDVDFEPPDQGETLVVAAKGDVFDLHLVPHFRWSSGQMPYDTLAGRSASYLENARSTLLHRVWPIARSFPPAETIEAEKKINEEIAGGWCYNDIEGTIRCHPSVRVVPDPRLREYLLPFEYGMVRTRKVEALVEEWLQVFSRLELLDRMGRVERQFLLRFAASLTDKDFAAVTHALDDVRRTKTTELAGVLQHASRHHDSVGLFEFASAYDKAYQAFCRQMGLDPFSWAQEPFGGEEPPAIQRRAEDSWTPE
jgi:hypothetical protein